MTFSREGSTASELKLRVVGDFVGGLEGGDEAVERLNTVAVST